MRFGQPKKTEEVIPVVEYKAEEKPTIIEPADLNSTGFALIKGSSGYELVTLKFNPMTMQAKVESVKKVSDSREEGEYHFKITVGNYFADQESKS